MKYQVAHEAIVDPHPSDGSREPASWSIVAGRTVGRHGAIEDDQTTPLVRATTRSDRWLGVAIAIATAVISLGFVGGRFEPDRRPSTAERFASERPATTPMSPDSPPVPEAIRAASFDLDSPMAGAAAVGGVVSIRATAKVALTEFDASVIVGEAELGRLHVGHPAAGSIAGDIAIFVTGFDVPARVVISATLPDGSSQRLDRAIVVRAGTGVTLWRAAASSADATSLDVDGMAPPTVTSVSAAVLGEDGRRLASAEARIAPTDERPASDGGVRTGSRRFHARLRVDGPVPAGGWLVEIQWRGATDQSRGSATQIVAGTTG